MKAILIMILAASFSLVSCSTTRLDVKELAKVEKELKLKEAELHKKTQIYVSGAITALKHVPKEQRTKEAELALRLLSNTQKIVGSAPEHLLLDINGLLFDIPEVKAELAKSENEDHFLVLDRYRLQQQQTAIQAKVIDQAKEIVSENKKGFFAKLKENIMFWATSVIVGLFALFAIPKIRKYVSKAP